MFKGNGICRFPLGIYELVFLIDSCIYMKRNCRNFLHQFRIHILLIFLEPVIFAEIHTRGIGYARDTLVIR